MVAALTAQGKSFEQEIKNPFASTALAQAILAQDASFGQPKDELAVLRQRFPAKSDVTIGDVVGTVREIFAKGGEMPLTLIVLDEVQQFIGTTNVQRAMDVQEIAERFCSAFQGRLLLVGTGQRALTETSILQRLIARFPVSVSLSDADVENVVRKVVLAKRADKLGELRQCLTKNQGEIDRHLYGRRLGPVAKDQQWHKADYPLLPVRRRLWEKVLRAVDTTGPAAQLRNQLTTVFEAAIASRMAAEETLHSRGNPTSAEGVEARKSIESKLHDANIGEKGITAILGEVLAEAKVFQGGGAETSASRWPNWSRKARRIPSCACSRNSAWPTIPVGARSSLAPAPARPTRWKRRRSCSNQRPRACNFPPRPSRTRRNWMRGSARCGRRLSQNSRTAR